jgi:HD-GYP domain-containing protein (c-di-GMP phosphodiesterase class II)
MAQTFPQSFCCLDPTQSLQDRLAAIHARIQAFAPTVKRLAFALYQPSNDLLSTYVSHNQDSPTLTFYDASLKAIPSLRQLAESRCCRVIDDMALELPRHSVHSQWLLQQGWRSSYTLPLFRNEALLGFIFLNAQDPGVFTPVLQQQLDPHLELLGSMLSHELTLIDSLRLAVRLALQLTGLRDPETRSHLERVSLYSRLIAMELGRLHDLRSDFAEDIYLFAGLHDIGKVAIPDRILRKSGPLDDLERQEMDTHVQQGTELVESMVEGLRLVAAPKLAMLRQVVAGHHEKLDGSGYPLGCSGDQIPLEARIVAVADIYDALSQRRSYKPALPEQEVAATLRELVRSGKIDGECVEILLASHDQRQAIAAAFRDPEEPGWNPAPQDPVSAAEAASRVLHP